MLANKIGVYFILVVLNGFLNFHAYEKYINQLKSNLDSGFELNTFSECECQI